ncbi:DUF6226 family protein [Propionicimonas sp.]|uniref:DUF6226 family protein n=1 Tax=Propionicimonas sp. TaxID=1955623 RepID=UPI0039E60EF9
MDDQPDSHGFPHPPAGQVRLGSLLAKVDAAFARTGAGTPGWPDPHRGRRPAEEEYSRCLDPGRYHILFARREAWLQVLVAGGVVRAACSPPTEWIGALRPRSGLAEEIRLTPVRAGGLSLVLGTTVLDGEPFGIDAAVHAEDLGTAYLATLPDCGCDACDSGSSDLLGQLDRTIITVAGGGIVHARRDTAVATLHLDGGTCSGDADWSWLNPAHPPPHGVTRWSGTSWLR